MEEVVEIGFPIPLGVDVHGQVHAGEFAGEALLALLAQHRLVIVIALGGVAFEDFQHAGGLLACQHLAPALVVDGGLGGELFGLGDVEFAVKDRIAGGVFVDVGGAVADPLAGDEDGQFDVELDLAHLERGGVPVAHEVADQALIVLDMFGAGAVGDAGGLHDGGVVAHVVDDADEAVVEDFVGDVEMRLHPFADGAEGGARYGAGGFDFGFLVGGQRHGAGLSNPGVWRDMVVVWPEDTRGWESPARVCGTSAPILRA